MVWPSRTGEPEHGGARRLVTLSCLLPPAPSAAGGQLRCKKERALHRREQVPACVTRTLFSVEPPAPQPPNGRFPPTPTTFLRRCSPRKFLRKISSANNSSAIIPPQNIFRKCSLCKSPPRMILRKYPPKKTFFGALRVDRTAPPVYILYR